jgi:hypothetical protein
VHIDHHSQVSQEIYIYFFFLVLVLFPRGDPRAVVTASSASTSTAEWQPTIHVHTSIRQSCGLPCWKHGGWQDHFPREIGS